MAERKAVNKYYPPEWTPSQGSINKFRGTHALRERARKLHMGILIIRFEMPFNIWCEGCHNHIGMGVRYNAEKTKVGMYYSTPIYKFKMKCHLCTNHFEIQTDPQNLDYVILNGASRQERRWDPTENEQVAPEEKDVSKKLATDAMYRLEHTTEGLTKQKAIAPTITQLEEHQEKWKNDYLLNKALRNTFREKKKILKITEDKDQELLNKYALDIALLPETPEDTKLASLLKLIPLNTFEERQKSKREEIISRPLFGSPDIPNMISRSNCPNSTQGPSLLIKTIAKSKRQTLLTPLTANQIGIVKKTDKEAGTVGESSNENNAVQPCSTAISTTSVSLVAYDSDASE